VYGGRFRRCAAYALSPRRDQAITAAARTRLEPIEVRYRDDILNVECPEYGSANRVAAAAYIEEGCRHEVLVVPDSDTLILRKPIEMSLGPTRMMIFVPSM
jgi:hypothetical protein